MSRSVYLENQSLEKYFIITSAGISVWPGAGSDVITVHIMKAKPASH